MLSRIIKEKIMQLIGDREVWTLKHSWYGESRLGIYRISLQLHGDAHICVLLKTDHIKIS